MKQLIEKMIIFDWASLTHVWVVVDHTLPIQL